MTATINSAKTNALCAKVDGDAFMRGWIRWCIFDDFDSCRSEDERKGWNYAARENELGGARPSVRDAEDALADYIRFGFR